MFRDFRDPMGWRAVASRRRGYGGEKCPPTGTTSQRMEEIREHRHCRPRPRRHPRGLRLRTRHLLKSAFVDVGVEVPLRTASTRRSGSAATGWSPRWRALLVEHALGDTVRSLHARHFNERFGLVTALDGASELLTNLRERGLKPVLASSGDQEMTDQLLELIEDSGSLLERITGEDTDESKPSPELVEVARERGRRRGPGRRGHGVGHRGGGQGRCPLRRVPHRGTGRGRPPCRGRGRRLRRRPRTSSTTSTRPSWPPATAPTVRPRGGPPQPRSTTPSQRSLTCDHQRRRSVSRARTAATSDSPLMPRPASSASSSVHASAVAVEASRWNWRPHACAPTRNAWLRHRSLLQSETDPAGSSVTSRSATPRCSARRAARRTTGCRPHPPSVGAPEPELGPPSAIRHPAACHGGQQFPAQTDAQKGRLPSGRLRPAGGRPAASGPRGPRTARESRRGPPGRRTRRR